MATEVPYKRLMRNFLLDARFQLKFASYIVAITLVISAFLGLFLYQNAQKLFAQIDGAVDARSKAADTSRELGTCTINNDIAKNLDNPDFDKQLKERSEKVDREYESEKQAIESARANLVKQQQTTAISLVGALLVFIVVVGFGTIVATHRIVGPLFRVKRMANEVAGGRVVPPTYGLRPSDELKDLFDAFSNMVNKLRDQQVGDLQELGQAMERAKHGSNEAVTQLETLISAMKKRIE